jgi:hypothetical protein
MVELMHPEWTMILHSTGKVIDRNDYKDTVGKFVTQLIRKDVRCIYENNDIMVSHSIVTFSNGTVEGVMYVGMHQRWKIVSNRNRFHTN